MAPRDRLAGLLGWVAVASLLACLPWAVLFANDEVGVSGAAEFAHVHAGGLGWIGLGTLAVASACWSERAGPWTTAKLGFAAGGMFLVVGSVVGLLAVGHSGIELSRTAQTHAAALTVPFCVLVSTALVESALRDEESRLPADILGFVQVGLIVLGGLALVAGSARASLSLLVANVPLQLAGAVIFLFRVGPRVFGTGWSRSERVWLVIATAALAFDLGLFAHAIFEVARRKYVYVQQVPTWLIFAVDHVTFVAMTTSALFGVLAAAPAARGVMTWTDRPSALLLVVGLLGMTVAMAASRPGITTGFAIVTGVGIALAAGAAVRRISAYVNADAGLRE